MKRLLKKAIALLLVISMFIPTVHSIAYATSEDTVSEDTRPVIHGNEVIEFSVNKKGRFDIRTTEMGNPLRPNDSKKSMLFYDGKNETSFTTFRIDGEDYIFGENYAYSLSRKAHLLGETVLIDDSIVTTYLIGKGDEEIRVVQSLSVIKDKSNTNYGNVLIQYALQNKTGKSIEVGARILQDVMLGENDGPAIKIEDNFYDKEIELIDADVPDVWRSTDNEFSPNIVGFGRTNGWGNKKPDKMIIGHWQGLSQTAYDYVVEKDVDGNSMVNFTVESDYGRKDTAVAYYWKPATVLNEEVMKFETYYGLGQILDRELTYATNISAPTQLVVNEDNTGYVNDGEFEVAVMIENNLINSEELYDVMAYLTYEDANGAVKLDNDAALKGTKLIKIGGHYTFRWKLKATAGVDYKAIKYKVDLYDRRNVYKEGDIIPEGKKVGDVRLDEIYTVSKGLILPSMTGAPPSITFGTIAPNEIYYSGKNLVSVNCTGIPLLTNKSNWQLEYRIGSGQYEIVPSTDINVVADTNSLEIMFDEQLPTGEMEFRIKVLNDMYNEGTDTKKHILKDDILTIPGKILITKDKTVMPRTYGMLAIVSDVTYDGVYDFSYTTQAIPLGGEKDLEDLKEVIEKANEKDVEDLPIAYQEEFTEREILTVISGDIRAVRDNGDLSKYVIYASHKKAIINNIITYTSAMPLTIQFNSAVNTIKKRTSIDWLNGNGGMSDNLKELIEKETTIDEGFSETPSGVVGLIANDEVQFDFTYVDKASDDIGKTKRTMDFISGVGNALSGQGNLNDLINNDTGVLAVTGLGILGINSGDGFDFWMDMFTLEFHDDIQYTLWEADSETTFPVQFNLEGVGSVLNKALDGLPVQIGGVRLAYDADRDIDMLTFDATVDLTMLPGGVVVSADDIFFSTKGYEGMVLNVHVEPEAKIGIIGELNLDVGIDTYNGGFSIEGEAQIKVVKVEIEFSLIKERKNDTWYLNDAVLAGGGEPGIQPFPGVFITKLGGGVRNLAQLTNPYYDNPDAIFTVVILMDLDVAKTLEGSFEGQITRRYIQVSADEVAIKELDIFRDLSIKLCWDTDGEEAFYIKAKGSVNVQDILIGTANVYISDIFFEGTCKLTVTVPSYVPIVGGMDLAKAFFGINNDKIWGALKVNLLLFSVEVGATFWWRGKFEFNVGEAGPIDKNENLPMQPKGALYEGTTIDENGETIDYSVGTNIDVHNNSIVSNSIIQMRTLNNVIEQEYVGEKVLLIQSENKYHKDGQELPDTLYAYDINVSVEDSTKLVFEYLNQIETEEKPSIELFVNTKNEAGELTNVLGQTEYDNINYVDHVNGDKNYITATGFTNPVKEQSFVVISDTPLENYIIYTETISDDLGSEYIYEFTLDTNENTKIAFKHNSDFDGDLELTFYKHTGTTYDGKKVIGEIDEKISSKKISHGGQKITVYEGFEPNLKGVTFIASSNQDIAKHTMVNNTYTVETKYTSPYGSELVAEFASQQSIEEAEVFYVTDSTGDPIQLPQDEDISSLYNKRGEYYTMLFPFEKAGVYHVYSTVEIDGENTKVYEIENMPVLDENSVSFEPSATSSQKLDISWSGSNYRYTADEAKGTDKTVFSFYLVDANEELTDEYGEKLDVEGVLLGIYDIEENGPNKFTVDIPRVTKTGDYKIKVVLSAEGLCQRFEYSDEIYHHINHHAPEKVSSVIANTEGNGLLSVRWTDDINEDIEEYYIEVFDENKNFLNSFGTASVLGDVKEALIGGVYTTFNPDNPEESSVAGLETGKDYIIGITPMKKIDNETTMLGETQYSELIRLPEPNPPSIEIGFGDISTVDITELSYEIDDKGNEVKSTIITKGINSKSPIITIQSDQDATYMIQLDKVELQKTTELSDGLELQLNKLTEGVHYLDIVAKNADKDISHTTYKFYVDTRSPELLVDSPESNQKIATETNMVRVNGRTEVGATVKVNGKTITVNDKGIFDAQIELEGNHIKNEILIEAIDNFGNITKNKTYIIRNVVPIKDIVIKSSVPSVTKTIKKPIYKETIETMLNVFTKQMVEVPITTDEVIGYDHEVATENLVKMGKSYTFDVKGVPDGNINTLSNTDNYVNIDHSKVKLEIVEGKTLASFDENNTLFVQNNGIIVVKATYEVMGDNASTVDVDESFSYTKYFTMTSEFNDIYTDEVNNNNNHRSNKSDSEEVEEVEEGPEKVYREEDKQEDSIYVEPSVFEKLKENSYETIRIETTDYIITLENPNNDSSENSGEETNEDSNESSKIDETILSRIPDDEVQDNNSEEVIVPLSSIDLSLTLESPNEEEIVKAIEETTKIKKRKAVIVHFRHHGKLPTRAKVSVKTGSDNKNKIMYMYYYNAEKGELELYGYVKTNENGEIAFEIDHCSDYVFVEKITANNDNFVENNDSIAYISGMPDGTFAPDKYITRAEVATIISNLLKDNKNESDKNFSDIDMWAKESILKLASYGYVNGYNDGTFRPNNHITRAELSQIFANIINPVRSQSFRTEVFSDIEDSWAKSQIMKCYRLGIINGYNGKYNPDNYATRAEVVTIMNNMLMRDKDVSKKISPFSDVNEKHWAYEEILNALE